MTVPNKTIQTAIDLGTILPVTVTEDVRDEGGTWNVWYVLTPLETGELSVFAYGDASIYTPGLDVYLGPPGSEAIYLSFNFGATFPNAPIQVPVTASTPYYFKVITNSASASPANLTLSVEAFVPSAAPRGSIFINDDSEGYPAALLSATTGVVLQFIPDIVAGEGGNALPTGEMLLTDTFNQGKPTLYGPDYTVLVAAINYQTGGLTENAIQTNKVDAFYVGDGTHGTAGHARIAKIANTGAITTTWTLPAAHIKGLAPSPDEATVYLYGHPTVASSNIKQWATAGAGAFGADLVAAVAGYEPCRDLLCLADGTVIGGYARSAPLDFFARSYTALGATVQTYTGFTSLDVNFLADVRLFHALDDPTSFWVWTKQTSGLSQFTNLNVVSGAILDQFEQPYYENGYFRGVVSASPSALYGASECCPAFLTQSTVATTQTFTIRRQRRFLLPSSPDNRRMQIPTIELLMRTGIGLTPDAWGSDANSPQGANPQVMTRLSKDGGVTWSPERWTSAGLIGQYLRRVRLLQATGHYRNAVLEVSVTDPVDWQMLAAMGDPVEGSS